MYGGKIACASGADKAKVFMQLSLAGITGYLGDRVFSGRDCERSKPAPDVNLAAAAALGVDPATALVIEETATGVAAVMAAGATVFGSSSGGPASTAPQLRLDAGATGAFTRMDQLPALA